jgi:hypothetical protein
MLASVRIRVCIVVDTGGTRWAALRDTAVRRSGWLRHRGRWRAYPYRAYFFRTPTREKPRRIALERRGHVAGNETGRIPESRVDLPGGVSFGCALRRIGQLPVRCLREVVLRDPRRE